MSYKPAPNKSNPGLEVKGCYTTTPLPSIELSMIDCRRAQNSICPAMKVGAASTRLSMLHSLPVNEKAKLVFLIHNKKACESTLRLLASNSHFM